MTEHNGHLVSHAVAVSGFLVFGALAGLAGRRWLGRLRRGAVFRPPWCELASAGLSAVVGWRVASGALPAWWVAVPLLVGWLGVPLAAVDLASRRLPDALTLPAYPMLAGCLAVAAWQGPAAALGIRALFAAVVFGGVHAAVHLAAPIALGAGDVKLAGSLGAVLGAVGWSAVLVGGLLAALFTLALAAIGGRRAAAPVWRRSAPYGPGLLVATWLIAVFPGSALALSVSRSGT